MKRLLLLLCLVTCPFIGKTQNNIIPRETKSVLDINSARCKASWMVLNLAYKINTETEVWLYGSFMDMVDVIPSYIDTLNKSNPNYNFLYENKKMLHAMMNNTYYGKMGDACFLKTKDEFPIAMLKYKDNSDMFFLTNIVYPKILNTLQLTPRKRASKVIQSYVLPCLSEIFSYGIKPEMKYVCVGVIFGSKDFSSNEIAPERGEMVYMISSTSDLQKYRDGAFTEDEIIEKSDIFFNSIDDSDLKKIKIEID